MNSIVRPFSVIALALAFTALGAGCAAPTEPEGTGSSSDPILNGMNCISSQSYSCTWTYGEHALQCFSIAWPTDPTSKAKEAAGCVDPYFCDEYTPQISTDYYKASCHGIEVTWNDPLCNNGNCAASGQPR